ncbi:Outer membrane receptor for ferrienterochelin and colicins [Cnuella takakiae]|uniref:Outer membrane receptor for ferrienterochelin and colicins n=1 Tax=Cnuella takakiae TaxID=1302690 RepID=A0A1M5H915_9BACT|nr:TonB-dependent receptor [Cnuella takakiae]OLY91067.1 TonB-dependent receptor [Cnuella takakiae]SHG12471.1 Outer membrane receptor for ferrienterochelin and colicins [Cnuella takakiae]
MRLILNLILLFPFCVFAQNNGVLRGTVINRNTLRPVAAASVEVGGTGAVTDSAGAFLVSLPVGSYGLKVTAVGYKDQQLFNLVLTSGNETSINIELEPTATELAGVTVRSNRRTARAATLESPLSVQRLTTEEIRSNPGGNFDISRVIQTLPGVGGTSGSVGAFRNDIIIRGGAPNENVFYLDGIEIPTINHFATQGSGGGPTGILNVSFIEDVKLSSSAFDARYDNALSSVFQFRQKNGNPRQVQGNLRLSATEFAATFEGPIQKDRTTFLASVRRSYLQFLFKAIDLPIRPNYWDFQFKITHRINPKLTLTALGVGAIDEFSFAQPREATPEKLYIINSNPLIEQNSYTLGVSLRKQIANGYWNLALSRNSLDNSLDQFEDNEQPTEAERNLRVRSTEAENKLRFDVNKSIGAWRYAWGGVAQVADFSNTTFNRIRKALFDESGNLLQPSVTVNFTSPIKPFLRYGFFAQAGRRFWDNRLGLNFGIRADGNTFTEGGANLGRTLSLRISASYVLADKWTWNGSIGRYYRLPSYPILGFANNEGVLVNKDARYTRSDHYVTGIEFLPSDATRFTLEGFYKRYANVAVSERDGISLANLGGDFGVLGNEPVTTDGKGNSYGIEFFAQQKLTRQFFGVFSYTWFHSRFSGRDGRLVASAWDNRHLLSATLGYKLPRNWELGLRFRYQGGAPFTPFDAAASRLNYLSRGTGVLDYARINTLRLRNFNAADIRVDKKFNYRKWTLDLFIDISNFYGATQPAYPQYTFRRNEDNTAFLSTNGQPVKADGSNAIPLILDNEDGTLTPTFGFIVEF